MFSKMRHLLQFSYEQNFIQYRSLTYTLLLILSNLSSSDAHECNQCLAKTPSGTYRGLIEKSVLTSKKFCSFRGIRYGRAPVGNLRFEYPLLAEPLNPRLVFNAYEDGNSCVQIRSKVTEGSEDCLFLNVFTPEPPRKCRQHPPKPVLVFVHPGGFFFGSGSSKQFSPDFIIGKDTIFVTINYRLNVFGFLNFNVRACGGNMGLRDQVLALKWIQKNIGSFGGDPNRVTLSGESAGGLSVYLVAASPLSRGLLCRIISQSPVYRNSLSPETRRASLNFATHMDYKGNLNDPREIVRYLKRLPAKDLVLGYASFTMARSTSTPTLSYQPFVPSADASLRKTAFFPGPLIDLGEKVPDIGILVGIDDLDGAYLFSPKNLKQLISNVRHRLGELFPPSVYTKRAIAKLKKYYFGNAKTTLQQLISAINVLTDSIYFYFYQQISIFKQSLCNFHIWNYLFPYNGTFEHFKMQALGNYTPEVKGAVHGEELDYLYYARIFYPHLTAASFTTNDRKVLDELTTLWTNFARTGNPNIPHHSINVEWKPISAAKKSYLRIGANTVLVDMKYNERRRRVLDRLMSHPKKDDDSSYCPKSSCKTK